MIKILHSGMSNKFGGIESYLLKIATNMDREKYKFSFLIIGEHLPEWANLFVDLGCEFYYVTPRRKNPYLNNKEIRELMIKEKFDIVHCHLNSLSYITPAIISTQLGIPTIVHSRNAGNSSVSVFSKLLHTINFNRLNNLNCTKLAVSDYAGQWMFSNTSDFTVINNGLNTDKYRFSPVARELIRNELGIESDSKVIVHVGAFRKQKNHLFLLEIFKEVVKGKKDFKLLLIGEGSLKEEIIYKIKELQIEDSVIFAGLRKDIPNILSAADFFLFPSFYEGFPNAVIEAQASGLPCFVSATITNEVIINDNCHKVSLDESSLVWANKILVEKKNENRSGFADIVSKKGFSVEMEINKIDKIYEEILEDKAK